MDIRYDRDRDTIVVELSDLPPVGSSVETRPGLHAFYDEAGQIVRLELHSAAELIGRKPAPGGARKDRPPPAAEQATRKRSHAASGDVPPPCGGDVTVYSDGGCLGNPGPGGWAARIKYADGRILELGDGEAHTTNNRMELKAAIEALKRVRSCPSVTMVTDSEYLRKGITQWIHGWKRRGWLTAARKPVLNQDLWRELDSLNRPDIRWRYTRGHAGDPDNERCDELAQAFARGQKPELQAP